MFEPHPIITTYPLTDFDAISKDKEIRDNCAEIEWVSEMGATVPYCKKDLTPCGCQCVHDLQYLPCMQK
jgi:hypothetical protein